MNAVKNPEIPALKVYEETIVKNKDAWMKGANGKRPTLISGVEILTTN